MSAIVAVAGLAFAAVTFLAGLAIVAFVVKMAIRLILLPLLLVKWLLAGLVMLVVGPILFLVGAVLAVVFALLLAAPLLPFLALGALVWAIVRSNRPAVA